MRIVSLLPSLTELVCTLGRREDLVGVTHECDFPEGVAALPHLTRSRIPAAATSGAIDRLVAEQGGSLYDLDADLLGSLRPDLILTQAQCDVCAVNERTVRDVAATLPGSPRVESVNPTTLGEVLAMFRRVGDLIDRPGEADRLAGAIDATSDRVAARIDGRPRPRVVLLEWTDPPYLSGHWNPALIERAGGVETLGRAGVESRRATWDEVRDARPEILLLSPCGFHLDRVEREWAEIRSRPEWRDLPAVRAGRVALIDGNSYFSRPGPRLEASLRIAAAAIHPAVCRDLAPAGGWRLVGGDGR